ncbi:MAG: I78 family peptidase inhibitor [Erythrobacter sp.]|jgi:hypothetical protein
MRILNLTPLALPLAACAAVAETPPAPPAPPAPQARTCDAALVQGHIGHAATAEMGAAILAQSGAQTLRWGPPRSAWTMDYRQDRVNVRYDDAMNITEITCG